MKKVSLRLLLLVLLVVLCLPLMAQSNRAADRLTVKFDQPVTVNEWLTLVPGEYSFRQERGKTQANLFHIYNQHGNFIGNTPLAINVVYKTAGANPGDLPPQTQIVLREVGNKRYLEKIWFQGQNRGYDFYLAENAQKPWGKEVTYGTTSSQDKTGATKKGTEPRDIIVIAFVPETNPDKQTTAASAGNIDSTMPQSDASGQNRNVSNTNQTTESDSPQSGSATGSGLPQSDQSGDPFGRGATQDVKIEGCVIGTLGGSYLLTSSNGGKQYALRGDYDNIRESVGRVVTIWGVSQAEIGNSDSTSATGDSANADQSSASNTAPTVEVVTVKKLTPRAERCDTQLPQTTQ